jgi:hypothetical protein
MASSPPASNDIAQAWLTRPTKRYDHAILGDAIEAGGLAVKTRDGKTLELGPAAGVRVRRPHGSYPRPRWRWP